MRFDRLRWAPPLLILFLTSTALAEERYAVVIGQNIGDAGEVPLQYAETDANKFAAVLQEIGAVRAENLVLLQGPNAQAVRRALVTVNERIRAGRPESASLFVYYSGHADEQAFHLGGTHLSIDEFRGLVQGSAAAFRLSIVDACRSGGLTRVKGGVVVPRTTLLMRDDVVGEGTVFLTATSADEDAQESDEIRGSFFTHHLITGLLGPADDDRDGAVDLNEAYRFAYDNTLRASSRTLSGSQHPTFQQDLKGKGEVILTRWSAGPNRAFFTFPKGQNWLLIRNAEGGPIVAEVGVHSPNRTIGVRPGPYYVMGRGPRALHEGAVMAKPKARILVEDLSLRRTHYAQLVRKGGRHTPSVVHGIHAGYQMRSGLEVKSTACHGVFAGYSADLRSFTLIGRTNLCWGQFEYRGRKSDNREIDLELRIHFATDIDDFTIDFGIGAAITWLRQNTATFDVSGDEFNYIGPHGDVSIGLQYDFANGLYAGVNGAAMAYLFESRTHYSGTGDLETRFAARLSLSIGQRF